MAGEQLLCLVTWCRRRAVVVWLVTAPAKIIPACERHSGSLLWQLKKLYPGFQGLKSIKPEDYGKALSQERKRGS